MTNRKLLNIELGRMSISEYRSSPQSGIEIILDNIRSAHNVGSIFRSADAFKADRIWLCGISPLPPSAEIHKTALGAEDSVPWQQAPDALEVVKRLRGEGYTVLAVEQTEHSVSLAGFAPRKGTKYALVFGNEVDGVQQEVVDACDGSIEIPQHGTKHSLNVSVCAGVVLWQITNSKQD